MSPDEHWSDEALADSVLHNLSPPQARLLKVHLATCEWCAERYEEWQALLGHEAETDRDTAELKERLLKNVVRSDYRKSLVRHRKKRMLAGSIGVLTCVVFALLLLNISPVTSPDHYTAVQEEAVENAAFIHHPRTRQFEVTPVVATDIRGGVWVNDMTKEMLIRVEGLMPIVHKDYQMWFVDADGDYHDQLLELQNGNVILYLQGNGVQKIRHVRTSLEPKGGSPLPTKPDLFIVDVDLK